jgi:tetratricopeptide (TPR) repeat protein
MDAEELLSKVRLLESSGQLDGATYKKLGIKFFSDKNYGLAKEFFEKSYDKDKDLAALTNLGVVVGKYFNDYDKALKIFEDVIAKDKSLTIAYYNLACNLVRMKKIPEAIQNLKMALELGGEQYAEIAKRDQAFEPISDIAKFKELVPNYEASFEGKDFDVKI